MATSSKLISKLSRKLFETAEERESFESGLLHPQDYPEALLWMSADFQKTHEKEFEVIEPRLEQPKFISRIKKPLDSQDSPLLMKPGKRDLHEKGLYYILDYSSVIAASALLQVSISNPKVLDLCAAPGGKSLFAWRALEPSLLVSNEVNKQRLKTLRANLTRCGASGDKVLVESRYAEWFTQNFKAEFDVVILDAPCSGQSLLAKGEKALGAFHPAIINGNSNRQKRLLAQASEVLRPSGFILYSTCTFSMEENEEVIAWFLKKFSSFETVEVPMLKEFASSYNKEAKWCYRLFPQSSIGAGSFSCLLRLRA